MTRAASIHEQRTEAKVAVNCSLACDVSHAMKICVYRFVQEGLNNAFRHAGGDGHSVDCNLENSVLTISVQDRGGSTADGYARIEAGLGLTGLRALVESLGGTFAVGRRNANGNDAGGFGRAQ